MSNGFRNQRYPLPSLGTEQRRCASVGSGRCGRGTDGAEPLRHAAQGIEANEAAHECLGTDLRALSARVIEGAGADPSGAWPEEKSFFALGVDLDGARNLGNRYMQDAIVWVGADAVPKLILLR